jgi:hypothetical protein
VFLRLFKSVASRVPKIPLRSTSSLLPYRSVLSGGRRKENLSHIARRTAGDGTLARPLDCLVQISSFQDAKTADVLLGLRLRPVGEEHLTIGLPQQRPRAAGRVNAAGKLQGAGSLHLAVERVDPLDSLFGFGGRVMVVGEVNSNQILRHVVS